MIEFILFLPLLFSNIDFAQNDVAGSSDPALISRFPDFWIVRYFLNDFEGYNIANNNNICPKGKNEFIEGSLTSENHHWENQDYNQTKTIRSA